VSGTGFGGGGVLLWVVITSTKMSSESEIEMKLDGARLPIISVLLMHVPNKSMLVFTPTAMGRFKSIPEVG